MQKADCGKEALYAFFGTILMMPLLLFRRLQAIASVNTVIMILSLVSVSIIIYYSSQIMHMDRKTALEDYDVLIKDEDRVSYKMWDWGQFPLFIAGVMNLYEGNMVVLNIYSEAK